MKKRITFEGGEDRNDRKRIPRISGANYRSAYNE